MALSALAVLAVVMGLKETVAAWAASSTATRSYWSGRAVTEVFKLIELEKRCDLTFNATTHQAFWFDVYCTDVM